MNIIPREQWGSRTPLGPGMRLPATEVFLHHSVTTVSPDVHSDMRTIERVGIQRFGRLSYSYAVHLSGLVLEGQGTHIGAHTRNHNFKAFGIVWIGNYSDLRPTEEQIENTGELIRWLKAHHLLTSTAPIRGHKDVSVTACPGIFGYNELPILRVLASLEDDMPYSKAQLVAMMREAVREEFTDNPPQQGYAIKEIMERLSRELRAETGAFNQALDSWWKNGPGKKS